MDQAAEPPREFAKHTRACFRCKLIKTFEQFFENGCDNCSFFQMVEDRDRVAECTTASYSGIITVLDPKASWAAKWLRLAKSLPGCYALELNDEVPEGIAGEIEEHMERGR
mmetsp:Transcript_31359/g.77923  ORF Transcript_31359/g.77923 Transcript_31359/m.77923 type:complete len:111 (+) Transcript_31359:64-396(+)